jgi:hypothetical protein
MICMDHLGVKMMWFWGPLYVSDQCYCSLLFPHSMMFGGGACGSLWFDLCFCLCASVDSLLLTLRKLITVMAVFLMYFPVFPFCWSGLVQCLQSGPVLCGGKSFFMGWGQNRSLRDGREWYMFTWALGPGAVGGGGSKNIRRCRVQEKK